jgi:subtilisin family serine protease
MHVIIICTLPKENRLPAALSSYGNLSGNSLRFLLAMCLHCRLMCFEQIRTRLCHQGSIPLVVYRLEIGRLMMALKLVTLSPLMARTAGHPEVVIGLIDGPVAIGHPDLESESIRELPAGNEGICALSSSAACKHGTFVAGILLAKRGSAAPAICPRCTLLVRPIFHETNSGNGHMPNATPQELAAAIVETIDAGARMLNLSVALARPSVKGEDELQSALDYAARRAVIVVAAAGNQGVIASSVITRHPWAIPVASCDLKGRPLSQSNLGSSIGTRGVLGPGENITSVGPDGTPVTFGGTSAAAPFVTGAIALLWSEFPAASAAELSLAVRGVRRASRMSVAPPLLDAWSAYRFMRGRGYTAESGPN